MLYPIFDTDQHITEPPDFWTSRLAKKYEAIAPRVIDHPELGQGWVFGDAGVFVTIGLQSTSAEDPRRHNTSKRYDEIDPGCFDPRKRIEVMDIDGIGVTLLFPSIQRNVASYADDEVYIACVQAYNDGVMEWARAADPKRVLPAAMIPVVSIEQSVAELQRVARLGFKHYMFNQWPSARTLPSAEDDPFWSLLQETGMTMSFHGFGAGRARPKANAGPGQKLTVLSRGEGRSQAMTAASRGAGLGSTEGLALLLLSGVLERFPRLKIGLIETSMGWLPGFLERLDQAYLRHRWLAPEQTLTRLPSEYARQLRVNWDREWLGVKYRHFVGIDNIMFGTDYPHIGGFFPHTRFNLELMLQGVPEQDRKKMLWDNAAALYGTDYR